MQYYVKVGHWWIVFVPGTTKRTISAVLTWLELDKSKKQKAIQLIKDRENQNMDVGAILSLIEESTVPGMEIKYFRGFRFKDIENINFSKLVSLRLANNEIQSIEGIQTIKLDSLAHLDLSYNKIISGKPLRRICSKNLISLHIDFNPIKEQQFFAELNSKKIKYIQFREKSYYVNLRPSLAAMCKLQTKKIRNFCDYDISPQDSIRKRFPEITQKDQHH